MVPWMPYLTLNLVLAKAIPLTIFGVVAVFGLWRLRMAQEGAGQSGHWEAWPTHTGLQMRRRAANRAWEYRPATDAEQADYVEAESW